MIYLLIVNIAMAIGVGFYQLFFKKLTFFQWNRFYLLGMVLIALLIPIGIYIDLSSFFVKEEILPTIHFTAIDDVVVYASSTEKSVYLLDILKWIYAVGVVISLVIFMYRLWKLRKVFQYESTYGSFSFFKKVVLGSEVKHVQEISDHELVHVEQGHSYDIVLMELVSIFNWFNPIVYFIKKELKFQHECIADEICSTDKVSYAELLLAHAMKTDVNMLRHEFSNQSFLKKRIMMLFKNKSTNKKKYLYLSVLPLLGVVVFSTLVFNTSKAKEIVREVEAGVEEVKLPVVKQKEAVSSTLPNDKTNEKAIEKSLTKVKVFGDTVAAPKNAQKFVDWCKNRLIEGNLLEKYFNTKIDMSFTVNSAGDIKDLLVSNDKLGQLTDVEKVFVGLPNWLPAMKNGKAISTNTSFMIIFSDKGVTMSSNTDRVILSQEEKNKIREDVMSGKTVHNDAGDELFTQTEISPEPPGGMQAFRKWIGDNYQYPQAAIDAGLKGTIQASFVVEKDGNLSDLKIVRDLGNGTGEAAIELLKKSPKWSPGIQNGRLVRVAYTIPIRIDLTK